MPIHVDGIEDTLLAFDRLETVLYNKQILQIFQVAGQHVADLAKGNVHSVSGMLASAIFARAYAKDTVPYVIIGVEVKQPAHGHLIVQYGSWVEYGTVHAEPHPYLRPAADSSHSTVLTLVGEALQKLIGDAVRK